MQKWPTMVALSLAFLGATLIIWHLNRPIHYKRMLITRADSQHTCFVTLDQPLDSTEPYIVRKSIAHRRLVIVQKGKIVGKSSRELCTTVTPK